MTSHQSWWGALGSPRFTPSLPSCSLPLRWTALHSGVSGPCCLLDRHAENWMGSAHVVCPRQVPGGRGPHTRSGCRGSQVPGGPNPAQPPLTALRFSCPGQEAEVTPTATATGAMRRVIGPGPSTVEGDPQGSQPSLGLPVYPPLCFSCTLTGEAKGEPVTGAAEQR